MDPSSDGLVNRELSVDEYKDYFKICDHLKHSAKHNIPSIKKGSKKFYIVNSTHDEYISTKKYTPVEEKVKIKEFQKSFKHIPYTCPNKVNYTKPNIYYNPNYHDGYKEIQNIIIDEEKLMKTDLTISKYWNNLTERLSSKTEFPTVDKFDYDKSQFKSYSTFEPSDYISEDFGNSSNHKIELKTNKIRFYPTEENVKYFNFYFDSHDHFYNLAVTHINDEFEKCKVEFDNNPTCCINGCTNPKSIIPKLVLHTCIDHKKNKIKEEDKNDLPNCLFCDKPKRVFEERKLYTCDNHLESKLKWDLNLKNLDNILVPAKSSIIEQDKIWMKDLPSELGKNAVNMAIDAFKGCCTRKKNGSIKQFKLKLRDQLQYRICGFDKRAIHVKSRTVKILDKKIKVLNRDKKRLSYLRDSNVKLHSFKMIRSSGNYYLLFPVEDKVIDEIKPRNKVISLDPGIRTFQSGFDPSGIAYKFGENEKLKKIENLFLSEDKIRKSLSSTIFKLNYKTKYNLIKKFHRIKLKVTNIIGNMHNQISSFLSKNYDNVILPLFMSSQMLKGKTLNSRSKRWLSVLSHFKFMEKLTYACSKNKSNIYLANESYTTKCCGRCGTLNNVGSSEIFNCINCGLQQDRDLHAARNIYLRRVTMKN